MGVFFTILLTLAPIAYCQTSGPVTAEAERQTEIHRLQTEVAQLPSLKVDSVEQAIKFDVEDSMLTVRTSLHPEPGQQTSLTIPAMRGFMRLTLLGPQDDPQAVGRNFSFLQQDLTDAEAGQVYTNVSAIAGQLILSRDSENEHYTSSVQLVQDAPLPAGTLRSEDPVRLLVHRSDNLGKENEFDLKLSAPDLTQLRKKHAREVDQYLRPIFRDFKQEAALFGVKPQIAWQVLASNSAADPVMTQRINDIIKRLDADSFRDRQAALAELKQIGQPAAMNLSKMDRGKLSVQQNAAIESFLVEFAPLASEEMPALIDDKGFLLDVLYNDDPTLRKLALERLSKLTGRHIELDANLDTAARSDAIAKLRKELFPEDRSAVKP